MKIIEAKSNHFDIVRALFHEYKKSVSEDGSNQCFGGFEEELASLPGTYAPPKGVIFLAVADDSETDVIGCVAIKPNSENAKKAEIKRLFVRPERRSTGAGKQLLEASMEFAQQQYSSIYLETVASMVVAKSLYQRYGFKPLDENQAEDGGIECYQYLFDQNA